MPEVVKTVVSAARKTTAATRKSIWKYFGALIMEPKGPNGELALSLNRVLALVTYVAVMWIWLRGGVAMSDAAQRGADGVVLSRFGEPPESMLYTLWGLIGLRSVTAVVSKVGGAKSNAEEPTA